MLGHYRDAIFISDLHLTEDRGDCLAALFKFLDWLPQQIGALFILGDFFDFWVGDDIDLHGSADIAQRLRQLAMRDNLDIYLLVGNRDFAIGQVFCERCGMTLINDDATFSIGGRRVSVSHGDLFCTDDRQYQRFRRIIRQPWLLGLMLRLSATHRIRLAHWLRQRSKNRFRHRPTVVDVNRDAVARTIAVTHADVLVHGHTHLADIHQHQAPDSSGQDALRVVLGDWHDAGWYARINTDAVRLHRFSIAQPDFEASLA